MELKVDPNPTNAGDEEEEEVSLRDLGIGEGPLSGREAEKKIAERGN